MQMYTSVLIPCWPGFFWITFLLYNTNAQLEGEAAFRACI